MHQYLYMQRTWIIGIFPINLEFFARSRSFFIVFFHGQECSFHVLNIKIHCIFYHLMPGWQLSPPLPFYCLMWCRFNTIYPISFPPPTTTKLVITRAHCQVTVLSWVWCVIKLTCDVLLNKHDGDCGSPCSSLFIEPSKFYFSFPC